MCKNGENLISSGCHGHRLVIVLSWRICSGSTNDSMTSQLVWLIFSHFGRNGLPYLAFKTCKDYSYNLLHFNSTSWVSCPDVTHTTSAPYMHHGWWLPLRSSSPKPKAVIMSSEPDVTLCPSELWADQRWSQRPSTLHKSLTSICRNQSQALVTSQ